MNASVHPLYANPSACDPLWPESGQAKLAELTYGVLRASGRLADEIPSVLARQKIAGLVRGMNSYYSNLIEGHRTLPQDIERAMHNEFSAKPKERDNQLLQVAHIRTQTAMEARLRAESINVFSPEFICWLHETFYRDLPVELQRSETTTGGHYQIIPGRLRDFPVRVGSHIPPEHSALPDFLARFNQGYNHSGILATHRLIVCAAAHHRLMWIHPFGDGNGRVGRLFTHACLIQAKVDSLGLWTISRGLARHRQQYYAALDAADQPRRNDRDGRGNLSDAGLAAFCQFFLETMLDQIEFMAALLEPSQLAPRMELYAHQVAPKAHREELARLLKALLMEGELARGRVPEIIGKSESTAVKVIKLALAQGLAETPSPKGKLQIAFPAKVLDSYFPRLFLDLPMES